MRPIQAALTSAASFTAGAALTLLVVLVVPRDGLIPGVGASSLMFLTALGAAAARTGGAPPVAGAWRVSFWGALAMAITGGVGALFGTAVG